MATRFHVGEIVSTGYEFGTTIAGRVVELRRKSDGKPFLMVLIRTGPRQGQRTWPNEAWELGLGPHQGQCERCDRPFRFQSGEPNHTCATCNRDELNSVQRRAANPDRPNSSWERKQGRDREKEPVTS